MEAGAVRVRRSAGIVRIAGERAEKIEGDTKSSKPRAVDVDAETIAVWRAPMVTMTVYAHVVSEGGLEPPCPFGALAPQASASANSATRT